MADLFASSAARTPDSYDASAIEVLEARLGATAAKASTKRNMSHRKHRFHKKSAKTTAVNGAVVAPAAK